MNPLGDYVFIRKSTLVVDKASESGILLPDSVVDNEEKATEGTIEGIGPDVQGLEIGQRVLFNEHQYDTLKNGNGYCIMVGKKTSIYATYAD